MTDPAARPRANRSEIVTALALALAGGLIALEASGYPLGTTARMGPGFVPLSLGVLLAALGVVIAVTEWHAADQPPAVPWRPILAVSAGLLAWALLADRAGLIAANAALVTLAALAEPGFRPVRTLLIFAGLTALGYVVFVQGLRVPIPLIRF